MATYGINVIEDVDKLMDALSVPGAQPKQFSIDVENGISDPPVIEMVRALRSGLDMDVATIDRLTRYCIKGKKVTIYLDDEPIGPAIVINDFTTPWDMFEAIKKQPMALEFIFNICQAHVLKKSIPPMRNTPGQAAGTGSAANLDRS